MPLLLPRLAAFVRSLRTLTSASLPRKNRVVEQAVKLGLANAKVVVADLTAQEAGIPHPNEMGLVGGFVRWLEAAASRAGQQFEGFLSKAGSKLKAAKEQVRKYRLFAKDETKAAKGEMVAQMASIVEGIGRVGLRHGLAPSGRRSTVRISRRA